MEQTTEQQTAEILNWVKTTLNESSTFVREQAPLLVQEYLNWFLWGSVFWMVVAVVVCGVGIRLLNYVKQLDFDDEIGQGLTVAAILCIIITFFGVFCAQASNVVKVTVSPRVVVAEKFLKL